MVFDEIPPANFVSTKHKRRFGVPSKTGIKFLHDQSALCHESIYTFLFFSWSQLTALVKLTSCQKTKNFVLHRF